jgi:hypothetical protein
MQNLEPHFMAFHNETKGEKTSKWILKQVVS